MYIQCILYVVYVYYIYILYVYKCKYAIVSTCMRTISVCFILYVYNHILLVYVYTISSIYSVLYVSMYIYFSHSFGMQHDTCILGADLHMRIRTRKILSVQPTWKVHRTII